MSSEPSTGWNYSIEDTSPVFSYSPYANGYELSNGWVEYFSGSGFMKDGGNKPGNDGVGDSAHVTSLNGASVTLDFWGRGVNLYGSSNATYQVTLDNTQQQSSLQNGLLYSNTGLSDGQHKITLTALPTANSTEQVWFDRADIYLPYPTNQSGAPSPNVIDNTNPSLTYSSNWETRRDSQVPNQSNPTPFHITSTESETMSFEFDGGQALVLRGSRNAGHGKYSVIVDNQQSVLNGSTWFLVGDSVLYFHAFEQQTGRHVVNVTNISDKSSFALSSVTLFGGTLVNSTTNNTGQATPSITPSGASRSVSGGAIAGAVIGALLGIVLITAAILFFLRRRRLQRSSPQCGDPGSREKALPKPHHSVTPFWTTFADDTPTCQIKASATRSSSVHKPKTPVGFGEVSHQVENSPKVEANEEDDDDMYAPPTAYPTASTSKGTYGFGNAATTPRLLGSGTGRQASRVRLAPTLTIPPAPRIDAPVTAPATTRRDSPSTIPPRTPVRFAPEPATSRPQRPGLMLAIPSSAANARNAAALHSPRTAVTLAQPELDTILQMLAQRIDRHDPGRSGPGRGSLEDPPDYREPGDIIQN